LTILAVVGGILAPQASAVCPQEVTAKEATAFQLEVWQPKRWQRGAPPKKTKRAHRRHVVCAAGPRHRRAIRRGWQRRQAAFFKHRRTELWRERVTPYPGGGRRWAIPYYIVVCESGARINDPAAPNGAHSLLAGPLQGVPTWESWRPRWAAKYALPYQAPKRAQDVAAHRLLAAYGTAPWECA
jgi:hypothetical protein